MYDRDRNEKYEIYKVGLKNQVINLIYTYDLICLTVKNYFYFQSNQNSHTDDHI